MGIMNRDQELDITRRLLEAYDNPTVTLIDTPLELDVDIYHSPERDRIERKHLFGRTPLMAALTQELPEPGSWKLFDQAGWPVILVRGDDGVVRGFLNVCGHRGARLVSEDTGTAKNFSCPYHGWTYRTDGSLAALPARKAFPGCVENRDLREVQVREHLGGIWVTPDPDAPPMDLDDFLGPFAPELAGWGMDKWYPGNQLVHTVEANWKVTNDTFTELYHVPVLHKASIGALLAGNVTIYDAFGDHHRQVVPNKQIANLKGLPEDQWKAFDDWMFAITYSIYPNVNFMVTGTHAEMYQVFPGPTVDQSFVLHSLFAYQPIETEEDRQMRAQQLQYFFDFVDTEDFAMCRTIQQGIRSGAHKTFVLGTNEAMTQNMHRSYQRDYERALAAETGRPRLASAGS